METKKLVAILVVAILAIAGAGVVFTTLKGSDGETVNIDAKLEVFGNANGDDKIDQRDIDIIEDIIAGKKSLEDYPLADAYQEGDEKGVVNEADLQQVRAMIDADANNKIKIWHINHYNGEMVVVDTMYPITSAIATGAANTILVFKYLGIVDEIKGFSWVNAPDSVLFSEYMHLITDSQRLATSATKIDVDKASNLKTSEGVTAAITADNRTYLSTEEPILEGMNIDVVRIQPAAVDSDEYMSSILLIAYLFDTGEKGYINKCTDLIDWYEGMLTNLKNKLDGVTKKVNAVASSSTTGVSTASSDYTDVLTMAGANFPLTDLDSTSTVASYKGTEDTWLNTYDIDYVICLRAATKDFSWYGGTALTTGANVLSSYIDNWKTLECYENNNVYVIAGDIPVMLRIAYAAQVMYGDVVGDDYGDVLHKDFVEKFFGWNGNVLDGKTFVVTMQSLGISA